MIAAAEAAGVTLMMASKFRYAEDVVRAKSLVASGLIGNVVLIENSFTAFVDMSARWNSVPAISGGGVLIDNGTHSLDILRYFLGPLAELQVMEGKRIQSLPVEDTVLMFVRSASGVLGSIDVSWSIGKKQPDYLRIHGSQGTVLVGWQESKYQRSTDRDWVAFGGGYDKVQAFCSQLDNFCRTVRRRESPLITPDDALASVQVVEAAYRALRHSTWHPIAHVSTATPEVTSCAGSPRMNEVRVHPTAILEDGVAIGRGSSIWDNVHIRHSTTLGEECIVGGKTYIAYGVRIGNRVKINAAVYIAHGVTIEDGVMISAGTVFTNDRFPRRHAGLDAAVALRSRRAHAAHAGPREGDDRRTVHDRLRPASGPLRHGRDGLGRHQVGERFSPGGRQPGPADRLRLPLRPVAGPFPGGRPLVVPAAGVRRLPPRVRRGRRPGAGTRLNSPQPIAVLGGGLLGLTIARRLAQQGHRVTVFEAADCLGGLASAWRLGPAVWDRYYHVTLLSDGHLRGLLDELGLDRELRWVAAKTGFYADGRLHSLSSAWEFLRFPPLGLWSKLRLGATIWYASKLRRWEPLEAIPVADWLRRWSGRTTCEKIWLPLLRAKLGENYRQTNAAFIWATIARMYAARRAGLKQELFGYVPGGYAKVLARFADELARQQVEIRLGKAAQRSGIPRTGPGLRPLRGGDGGTVRPGRAHAAGALVPRLCPGLEQAEADRFAGVKYLGVVCASLLLKRPLAEYYITNITDPRMPFTAVIEMSALVDREQFGGHALVYLPKYLAADSPDFALPDDVLRERWLAGLEMMYPHFDRGDIVAFQVARTRLVMPIPTLGYSRTLPPVQTSLPGVYAVNSAHIVNGTLNVNETVKLAERFVAQFLADRQRPNHASRMSAANDAQAAGEPVLRP